MFFFFSIFVKKLLFKFFNFVFYFFSIDVFFFKKHFFYFKQNFFQGFSNFIMLKFEVSLLDSIYNPLALSYFSGFSKTVGYQILC
jgi:hypothetical protein